MGSICEGSLWIGIGLHTLEQAFCINCHAWIWVWGFVVHHMLLRTVEGSHYDSQSSVLNRLYCVNLSFRPVGQTGHVCIFIT